jgi:hypothetical protein
MIHGTDDIPRRMTRTPVFPVPKIVPVVLGVMVLRVTGCHLLTECHLVVYCCPSSVAQ